jgi:hypothetical protein
MSKKGFTYVMLINLAFLKCKKTHQSPKDLMNNGLLNFGVKFYHTLQNSWIWIFILQCVSLMCIKPWDIGWIMF